jgi:subtilisin family serine protease
MAFPDLSVRVTTFDQRPIAQARVTARSGTGAVATATTDSRGRARLNRADASDLVVRVEAPRLEPQERTVSGQQPERVELFMLGRPGMPFYYRGTVRVPFQPINDAVGVLMRDAGADAAGQPRSIGPGEVTARAQRLAEEPGTTLLRSEGNFARSNIAVIGLQKDRIDRDPGALVRHLAARAEVEQVGALVQLSDEHASFLTDTVIARFTDGVDDAAVAQIAARHELTPVGRFADLGNVHRLRFKGPATYAVLDASNALADEPEILWAEPDLVHTVEKDAVTPGDLLFPEQWDHPIIHLSDAWQSLGSLDPQLTFGSPDITIAVVDSGVDVTHPEFSGTVSNGQPKVYQQFDFTNMAANMNNLAGDHGTCCASAATAKANNPSTVAGVNEGVAGVAGNCRLIAIRQGVSEARYAEMYLWAAGFDAGSSTPGFPAQITPGADVITNSFTVFTGGPISGLMSTTFDRLTDGGRGGRGVLLFFAAGNKDRNLDVALEQAWGVYDRCMCVSASTLATDGIREEKASYSNYGDDVDFCAPSSDQLGVVHDPPTAYGAHTATILTAPEGNALPGHPDRRTSLTAATAAGDVTITVGTVAGLAADQAILIGTVGTAGTEGRKITAVNAAANQVDIDPALSNTHLVGTDVAAGPFSHRSNFSGTSYATPVCAGTAALMLSANPHLLWHQVRDILRNTAVKIDPNNIQTASHLDLADGRWRDGSGRISTDPGYTGPLVSWYYGFGRIDAAEAVRRAASEWSQVGNNNPPWSDALGWGDVTNYSTMHLAVANNNLYLLARSNAGVDTWQFDTGTSTWSQVGNNNPPWSDALGWADVTNYSTMHLAVANNNLYLLARSNAGVDTWQSNTDA